MGYERVVGLPRPVRDDNAPPAFPARPIASSVSETVPIWLSLIRTALVAFILIPFFILVTSVT